MSDGVMRRRRRSGAPADLSEKQEPYTMMWGIKILEYII